MTSRASLSILIPTWRPDVGHLEAAVASVLGQLDDDPAVQIELVDDASPDFDVASFARRFAPGRVSAHRNQRRLGLAGNWNACIARAKHGWVHLLHQDDFVLDGFYAALGRGIERAPSVAAAYSASFFLDASGQRREPYRVDASAAGILGDWVEHVFVRLSIQCSAIVVRRDVYEALGGFDRRLRYTTDWDMWKRIAVRHPIWFEPEPLACFRKHPGSETSRQREAGGYLDEIFRSIEQSSVLLPSAVAAGAARRSRRHYASFAVEEAAEVLGRPAGWRRAVNLLNVGRRHTSSATVAAALGRVVTRGAVRRLRTRLRRGSRPPAVKVRE